MGWLEIKLLPHAGLRHPPLPRFFQLWKGRVKFTFTYDVWYVRSANFFLTAYRQYVRVIENRLSQISIKAS